MSGFRRASILALIPFVSVAILAPAAAQAQALSVAEPQVPLPVPQPESDQRLPAPGRVWVTAFKHSLVLLTLEHGVRIGFDEKTRRELEGPFFRDYVRSVHVPRDWEDGDSVFVNYIGHPIHGAAAGYLWRDAEGIRGSGRFGLSKAYWGSMGRSLAFIGVYSLQFEFGPLSEASIGNVGRAPETRGWVDHAVTPIMGFALMAGEDALDRYFVLWFERRVDNRVARAAMRLIFNPARMLANLAQAKSPWSRPDRPLGR